MNGEVGDGFAYAFEVQVDELWLRGFGIERTVGLRIRDRADLGIACRIATRVGQPPDLGAVAVVAS